MHAPTKPMPRHRRRSPRPWRLSLLRCANVVNLTTHGTLLAAVLTGASLALPVLLPLLILCLLGDLYLADLIRRRARG